MHDRQRKLIARRGAALRTVLVPRDAHELGA